MCQISSNALPPIDGEPATKGSTSSWPRRLVSSLWPVPPSVLVAALPCCMPSWCYINRGYTQWFHWNALFYLLTQSHNHASFLALQGLTVTLGWYAALCYDWYQHGRFGHILYWNMPSLLTQYIIPHQDNDIVAYESTAAVMAMLVAHA